MEQLALAYLQSHPEVKSRDIRFCCFERVRAYVVFIVRMFLLTVPDSPLPSTHSTYLASYYSLTFNAEALGGRLTNLADELGQGGSR